MLPRFKCIDNRAFRRERDDQKVKVDEQEKQLLLRERAFAPLVWCRLTSGFRIEDLQSNNYGRVLEMMMKYFVVEDVLCKASGISSDQVSLESFSNSCSFQMKDTTSLIAINEGENRNDLAGACIVRAVPKVDFGRVFRRSISRQGEACKKCSELAIALNKKIDIYADFGCEIYLKFSYICVKPEYRGKKLGFAMFRAVFSEARALKIPIIVGLFDCHQMQKYAKELGFSLVTEIRYSEWVDETGYVIFPKIDPKNESCALMVAKVEAEFYPEFLIEPQPEVVEEDTKEKKGKKGKKDKKGKNDKKGKKDKKGGKKGKKK